MLFARKKKRNGSYNIIILYYITRRRRRRRYVTSYTGIDKILSLLSYNNICDLQGGKKKEKKRVYIILCTVYKGVSNPSFQSSNLHFSPSTVFLLYTLHVCAEYVHVNILHSDIHVYIHICIYGVATRLFHTSYTRRVKRVTHRVSEKE